MSFQRGESGNPAGRPKGIIDKRAQLRDLLEPHAPELVAKLVELAKAGDMGAMRLCLDRLIPPMKAKDAPVELGPMQGTLSDQGRAILAAVVDGRVSPDEGSALLGALAAQARIVDVDELERRIAALENKRG